MKTFHITAPDEALRPAIQDKIDNLNKPKGSLGRLEELALQLALMQQTTAPALRHPCHLLFGADHGIEREGVSVSPREITWQQMINFSRGGGGVNMFCRQHGFKLLLVDMGVDYDLSDVPGIIDRKVARGTRDFLHEAAMTPDEADRCLETGAQMADDCHREGCNVLCVGGNGHRQHVAFVRVDAPAGRHPAGTLRGRRGRTGQRGRAAQARRAGTVRGPLPRRPPRAATCGSVRHRGRRPGPSAISGGFEMVAAVGAMLRAAELRMAILVDGFIMTACMLMAARLYPRRAPLCHFLPRRRRGGPPADAGIAARARTAPAGAPAGRGHGRPLCLSPLGVRRAHDERNEQL